ncbi:MAG: acetyl-CoA hydrolase/transferase C-terminal domain-containing protein [Xanthomonadaceae bacterium]|nr:acetyl-CoA hydrolase/transferase C-terminal domain-containing protein [Xanthomonadaceae bacterium]
MTNRPERLTSFEDALHFLLGRTGPNLVIAAPLGLGKPHGLLNAIYRHVAQKPDHSLHLMTALSLTPPPTGSGLQRRFLKPFLDRHFGADFPVLDHVPAQKAGQIPSHVRIEEFYIQSGALLGAPDAQRHYNNLNYTHAASAVAQRGPNALVQLVAREPGGERLSLSCNPDLTFDAVDEMARLGKPRPTLIAVIHPDLPFMDGDAAVAPDYFDAVLDYPAPVPKLFAVPRGPVSDAEHAIGLHASALVRDGGTLQIGIGALSDALSHAVALRHTRNSEYRQLLESLTPGLHESPLHCAWGGLGEFGAGLYGASEMITDGFMRLVDVDVIKRKVIDDFDLMLRVARGEDDEADRARIAEEGQYLHAAFFLGSHDFYGWLREMPPEARARIGMTRVSQINQLYGGREALERLQRRDARFFNTCMMATALGAAVSDALDDGRVVSGVGGQYNFVAMAHALEEGRSVLMLRSTRESGGKVQPSVLWNYGHTTIPRHLRDIFITEYGVADLRGRSDEECVIAMLAVSDARFIDALADQAKAAGKLDRDFVPPDAWRQNTPERLAELLRPYRSNGLLPDYPMGSDFTEVEQRLVRALSWLKERTATRAGKARLLARAAFDRGGDDREALQRMDLSAPTGMAERIEARLLKIALGETAG